MAQAEHLTTSNRARMTDARLKASTNPHIQSFVRGLPEGGGS
jgi:hypothetical protein